MDSVSGYKLPNGFLKTKNVLLKSFLKESIGFKMMINHKGKYFRGEMKKKTIFLIVVLAYLLIGLLKFQV